MNKYLENLNKIEFVLTYACTGRCEHCSEGEHSSCSEFINEKIAADAVRKIAREYDIKTVMVFGGEPLLHTSAVYEITFAAREMGVPKRQVITNGYFSADGEEIKKVVRRLAECGVNDLLLSVDAFHQRTIPLDVVKRFACELVACNVPIRLSPAYLVSREHDNPYNRKTKEILDSFCEMNIPVGEGNIVFPEGNALKYLSQYFTDSRPENPYVENPRDVHCVSFSPNGDVLGENAYERDIMDILRDYKP